MQPYNKIIYFDTETTGIDVLNDDVIELGFLVYEKENNTYVEKVRKSILIKIGYPVPPAATHTNHITDEMLDIDGLTITEAVSEFNKYYDKDALLIGYNVHFDLWMLERTMAKVIPNFELSNDFIDVLTIVKDFKDYPTKLETVIDFLQLEDCVNSHRACDDAYATKCVLDKYLKEIIPKRINNFDLSLYKNVYGYYYKYPVAPSQQRKNVRYFSQGWNRMDVYKMICK